MKALTYSQIISILEDIARRSYKINSFFLGQDWELAQSEAPVYPCLQVYPLTSVMPISVMGDYKSVVFEIQCKLLDLVGHDQFNQKSVHNDLHAVAQSIVNEINQNPYFVRSFVKMVGDVQFVNLEEVNDDFLAGWGWIIRFEIRNLNTFCGQAFEPVDGYSMSGPSSSGYSPSVRYLTCDTVTGCTTFQDYIQNAIDGVVTDNYYTTGGTLVGTTIQFDRNDLLNAYEVQLSGLTSGITATGAYLNLSGGTVTGTTNFTSELLSGGTDLYSIFSTSDANTFTTGATLAGTVATFNRNDGANYLLQLSGLTSGITATGNYLSLSGGTVTGSTNFTAALLSGGTDLYSIFLTAQDGNDITRVQAGTNISTGGTDNFPTVSVVDSPSFNNITYSGTSSGRIAKRVVVVASSATPTLNTSVCDIARLTGLTVAITNASTNLTGNPVHGDMFSYEITDNGTARTIAWGASFAASGTLSLPTTTVINTMLKVLFQYNAASSLWVITAWV